MGTGEYQLRCEIHGHEDDVRRICVCDDAGIATSSRDRTVRFWSPDPENPRKYALSKTMVGHTSFVGPLAWIPPSEGFEDGAVVSGGMDALVMLWDLKSGSCVSMMRGHRQQVTGLALDDNGDVVSASVDCTIIRWRKGEQVEAWEGHKVAIQAVAKLPSGEFVTGSSDATLKLWSGKTCLHTFTGHTDTVRGLAVMPGLGVLSASHDSSIRLWALTGQVLMEMVGHTSIVYCVDAHASGLIASGSEDCSLKLWKDGVCIQSIDHPGCVWDVKFLINGDIITACSDGTVRIWTTSTDRIAEPLEYESYASELSLYKSNRKSVGGIKLADLPGLEALQHPGNHDGQTKVIREGDNGVAYSWNSRDKIWDKIGEVVEGPEDGKAHAFLDGVKYDYVFDVDIGDGEPIRKLPYNLSDNPYTTADKWLLKEDLPLTYREQVVEFILQNSGQRNISVDHSFRDPYTGSSAYVPGEPSIQSSVSTQPIFKHIPKRGMLFFDSAQYDGILKKIGEYNNALTSDLESKHLSLTELDLSRLTAIVKILKDTSHYHCSTFADIDMDLLVKLLRTWPVAIVFPAIDILRMIILHPDGANLLHKNLKNGNDIVTEMLKKVTAQTLAANLLTTTRAITNLFKHSNFHSWLQLHAGEILDALSDCCSSSNKNVLLSYSTLLLNYAVLFNEKKDQEGQAQVFSASLEIADERNQDVDSKFRALVAVGSLILDGNMKSIAIDLDVASIAKAAKASKDMKVAEVGADIDLLLRN